MTRSFGLDAPLALEAFKTAAEKFKDDDLNGDLARDLRARWWGDPLGPIEVGLVSQRHVERVQHEVPLKAGQHGVDFRFCAVQLRSMFRRTLTLAQGTLELPRFGKAEEADIYTLGLVFTPSFMDGFSIAADFYDYDIRVRHHAAGLGLHHALLPAPRRELQQDRALR